MGPTKPSDKEYGEYTFRLNQHQGLLRDGSYIRVRKTDGKWQELQIYSKHNKGWFNVLHPGEDLPKHSIQLCNGGRWYQISGPGEWIPDLEASLEASTASIAPVNDTLPTLEDVMESEDILSIASFDSATINQGVSTDPEQPALTFQRQDHSTNQGPLNMIPTGDQCQDAYDQLPTTSDEDILRAAEDMPQQYPTLDGINILRPPIGDLALNLGELMLLRLNNPRQRRPLQDIDQRETALFQQIDHIFDMIEQKNPSHPDLVKELGNELRRITTLYGQQKTRAIAIAEPVSLPTAATDLLLQPDIAPSTWAPKSINKINHLNPFNIFDDPSCTGATVEDYKPSHPGILSADIPSNSTELHTPRLPMIIERASSCPSTIIQRTKADNVDANSLMPDLPEPRRKILPSPVISSPLYSPEMGSNEKLVQDSGPSSHNLPAMIVDPHPTTITTPADKPASLDVAHSNEQSISSPTNGDFQDHWDDVVANIILKSDQQKALLETTTTELLHQQQSYQRVQSQLRKLQPSHDHLVTTNCEMLTKQTDMQKTITSLRNDKAKSNTESNRLASREQELLKALNNRDAELRDAQRQLSSNMEHEKLMQAETTRKINQLVSNAHEHETNVERVTNVLTKKINQTETHYQDLARDKRTISQLESSLATCKAKFDEITRNENARISDLEIQLRDSNLRNHQNMQPYQPSDDKSSDHLRERSNPSMCSHHTNRNDPPTPTHSRDHAHEHRPDPRDTPNSGNTTGLRVDVRRHVRPHQQLTDIRSHLEEIEEFNDDITKMIKEAKSTLDEHQDGAMKDFRRTMSHEFNKLKDNSRRTKYAFKRELRRCLPENESEDAIDNEILVCNTSLLQEAGDLLTQLDNVIKSRGLNLSGNHNSKDSRIEYPTFSGQTLPLVGDFLEELEGLLVQAGVPVSGRGAILAQSVKGQAKNILSNGSLERNPSFNSQASILREHFGEAGTQMDLVLRLHKGHGTIPSSHDLGQSMSTIYNIVKNHMTLLKAASSLHQQYTDGLLAENPITGSYLNALEQFLPRTKREVICDASAYRTLNTAERFKKLREAYHQIQHFASTEVAKHGYDTEQMEPKRKTRFPNLITNGSTQKPNPVNQAADSTSSGPPQFQGTPPTLQLPLPQTRPNHSKPLDNIQCFKCNQYGHYANSCPTALTLPFCMTCHRAHLPGQCTPRPLNQIPGIAAPKARPTALLHNPDGTIFTLIGGQQIQLHRIEQGLWFSGITTCFICKALEGIPGVPNSPSKHIFTPTGRLERYLCPSLISIPTMEGRISHLDRVQACKACLSEYTTSQPNHNGQSCQLLLKAEGARHLKCSKADCRVRYTLCTEHKSENQPKLQEYIRITGDRPKVHLTMALTTSPGYTSSPQSVAIRKLVNQCLQRANTDPNPTTTLLMTRSNDKHQPILSNMSQILNDRAPNVTLNSDILGSSNSIFNGVRELIENTPTPFIETNENPHHFILFQMAGKHPGTSLIVCYDTASAYTLITNEAISDKIGGSPLQLPGTSTITGIGGERETNNFVCSLPLSPNEAGGYAAKIASCLSVDSIIDVDSIDTAGLAEYLRNTHPEQIPANFTLTNFRDQGSKIQIDMLIGIQELRIYPKLILTTEDGLNVYRVPLKAPTGGTNYCIGGTLPSMFRSIQATSLITTRTTTTPSYPDAQFIEAALTRNFNDPTFLGEYTLPGDITDSILLDHQETPCQTNPTLLSANIISHLPLTNQHTSDHLRPDIIICSPISPMCTTQIQHIQELILQNHPENLPFLVPSESLHITHAVLIDNNDVMRMFTEFLRKLAKDENSSHLAFTTKEVTTLDGNICLKIESPQLTHIMRTIQEGCDHNTIWYDPMQSLHITLFNKDYKKQLEPTKPKQELIHDLSASTCHSIRFIDICSIKRSDRTKYFTIRDRADSHSSFKITHTLLREAICSPPQSTAPSPPTFISKVLSPRIKGLCSDHRDLMECILPELEDWRCLNSTQSIIQDIYPSLGSRPYRSTIPVKLFDLLRQNRPTLSSTTSVSRACLVSDKSIETSPSLFDEDIASFRCLSCRLCPSCSSPGQGGSGTMSLREEVENLLIKNSVSIDLARNRVVARHVLPSNYRSLLGNNKQHCDKRLRTQLRKLAGRPKEEQEQVKASINKLITRGFVVTEKEFSPVELSIVRDNQTPYHIPTSIVFKSSSISSPSRVCLDGSAKTSTGYSINDLLPKGGLSLSIGSLIQNWKAFPVAASGDLANYYCRFALSPEFWPVQKFLWIDDLDPTGTPTTYYVKTIIYGLKPSGVVCHYGINKLIEVFDCLKNLTLYVDDAVAGYYTTTEAMDQVADIVRTLSRFNLPFKGDNMAITGVQPPKEILTEDGAVGINCVKWNPVTDTFTCNTPILYLGKADRGSLATVNICPTETTEGILQWLPENFTLKDLLSKTASQYDGQLGVLSSLIAPMRSQVRKVMMSSKDQNQQTDWTALVSTEDRAIFAHQIAEIKRVGKFTYRRYPKHNSPIVPNRKGVLMCFTDSGDFETVAIYLGLMQEDGKWCFNLITSKSYLIQENTTVPKSELQSGAHGANATQGVIDHFKGKLDLTPYLFMDSECCIHWISNGDSLLHIFHRNRVAAILSVFGKNVYHVNTAHNVADDISRKTVCADSVRPTSRLYQGPAWLTNGIKHASDLGIITSMSVISRSNLTPSLMDIFKSGVILSKYSDLNTMKLKQRSIKGSESATPTSPDTIANGSVPDKTKDESKPSPLDDSNKTLQQEPSIIQDEMPNSLTPSHPSMIIAPLDNPIWFDNDPSQPIKGIQPTPSTDGIQQSLDTNPTLLPDASEDGRYCSSCCIKLPLTAEDVFYESCAPELGQHAYSNIMPPVNRAQAQYHTCDNGDLLEEDPLNYNELIPRIPAIKQIHPSFMSVITKEPEMNVSKVICEFVTTRNQALNESEDSPNQVISQLKSLSEDSSDLSIPTPDTPSPPAKQADKNQPWSEITERMAGEISYVINPLGRSLPKICRTGSIMLKLIHTLLRRIAARTKNQKWDKIRQRIFNNNPASHSISLIITGQTKTTEPTETAQPNPPEGPNQSNLAQTFRCLQKNQILHEISLIRRKIERLDTNNVDTSTLTHQLLIAEDLISSLYQLERTHHNPEQDSEPKIHTKIHDTLHSLTIVTKALTLSLNHFQDSICSNTTLTLLSNSTSHNLIICSSEFQKDGWLLYPGLIYTRNTLLCYQNFLSNTRGKLDTSEWELARKLTTIKLLADSFRRNHCRPAVKQLGQIIMNDMLSIRNRSTPSTRTKLLHTSITKNESKLTQQLGFRLSNIWADYTFRNTQRAKLPGETSFVKVMDQSYLLSCFYVNILFNHLVMTEQRYMIKTWPKKRIHQHCVSDNQLLLCNTRWRASVVDNQSPLSLDPNSITIAGHLPRQPCPVLDKNSPLYISIAMFIHSQFGLPINKKSFLFQKHRGMSQDLALSLQYVYAPGGLSTFRRIHESCCICRFRTRKYLKTREGDLHHSQLVFVKPYFSVHLDLLGPLFIKLHKTAATRANDNERKIWLLCTICSFSKATWVEIMQGTSAADFSDALTRTMSVTGSICHIVTDRLATQLKVIKHGTFIEQIQSRLYKRMGWFFEAIPVSRHNANGLIENRIKGIRKMLSLNGSHTHMSLLEFMTHTRLATALINAVPFGYSMDATNHQDLRIISPSTFLYPLNSMNRPILSGVHLDHGDPTYFHTMRTAYEGMVDKYANAIIPYLMMKNHKFDEELSAEQVDTGNIVVFKKRPNSNFLPGWSLGRVVKTKPSNDGVIRTIVIEYVNRIKKAKDPNNPQEEVDQDEAEDYETCMKDMRKRVDKNTFKVQTTRQTDEVIRLHPISPQDNDIHHALRTILSNQRALSNEENGKTKYDHLPMFQATTPLQ